MKYRNEEWLKEQIKIHGVNGKKIAIANNYSPVTVQRYMKKFNLSKNKKENIEDLPEQPLYLYRQKEWLQEQFDKHVTVTEVSRQTGVPRTCISRYANRYDIYVNKFTRTKSNDIDENYFKTIDTERKAYWLGFFMADGNMYQYEDGRLQFAIKIKDSDYNHLVKLKEDVSFSGNIKRGKAYRKDTECFYSEIKSYNKIFCDNLIGHGIVPRKTGKECIPSTVPHDLIKHFLRGFLDGDGWISGSLTKCNSCDIGICSTNGNVCIEIYEYILKELSLKMRINESKGIYKIQTGRKSGIYDLITFLYKDAQVFLDRKYKKATLMMLEYENTYL